MAELARRAALASIDLSVEDDAGAHALLDQNHYEVAHLSNLGTPEPEFGERGGVGVVVGADDEPGRGANLARDVEVAPAEVRDEDGAVRLRVYQSGQAYADSLNRAAVLVDELARAVYDERDGLRGVGVCLKLLLFEDAAREVARGDDGANGSEVNADGYGVGRAKREEYGRPSAGGLARDLFDEAARP